MGRGREPWEWSETGGVKENERHLHHSPVSSPTEELRKDTRRSDNIGRRGRTRPGFICVLCAAVVREGLPLLFDHPMERVSSFKYLCINIPKDLTWTTHIQTQVKKARQRLYHLRQLRKFRVSPAILKSSLFRDHRKCTDSMYLSLVWKHL